jgi:multidrug resistance protein
MTRYNNDVHVTHQFQTPESTTRVDPFIIANHNHDELVLSPSPPYIEELSIYAIRSNARCKFILGIVSLTAILLPFCDTIYLPSLGTIERDLQTSATLVAISISIYLFMNGLFSMVWGPLSDRFGRKLVLLVALAFFVVVSIVCIFAPNIIVLIVFRAIQGAAVSATLVVGQGTVADIYSAEHRGWYTGIFFVPFLVGPVIGPLIGGALSAKFGWRSTFVLLTCFSFLILLGILFLLEETQQYIAMQRFERQHPGKRIKDDDRQERPHFQKPWLALRFLIDMATIPYIAVATTTFAGLFTSLALFGSYLAEEPYKKDETIIGVLFVPTGVVMLVGSLLGGWLSDKASLYFTSSCPEGRLVPGMIFSVLTPIGLMIYGWAFHYRVHLAGGIIGQMVLSFGQSVYQPTVFAYLTAKYQNDAAAASAANSVLNFCGAGVGVTIAGPLQNVMGIGGFYSLLSGINIVTILAASLILFRCVRASRLGHIVLDQAQNPTQLPMSTVANGTVQGENNNEHKQKSLSHTDKAQSAIEKNYF